MPSACAKEAVVRARPISRRLVVAVTAALAAVACSSSPLQPETADAADTRQSQAAGPSVTSMTPTSGPVGTTVTIRGAGFARRNAATFGQGFLKELESSDGTTITFTVPEGLDLCSPEPGGPCAGANPRTRAGDYSVAVMLDGRKSNALTFTVTP